jgi:hypothetical protein
MVEAATLRSGYDLKDSAGFADRIEAMLRRAMGISLDEKVDDEPTDDDIGIQLDTKKRSDDDENVIDDDDDTDYKSSKSSQSTKVCRQDNYFNVCMDYVSLSYLSRMRTMNTKIFKI